MAYLKHDLPYPFSSASSLSRRSFLGTDAIGLFRGGGGGGGVVWWWGVGSGVGGGGGGFWGGWGVGGGGVGGEGGYGVVGGGGGGLWGGCVGVGVEQQNNPQHTQPNKKSLSKNFCCRIDPVLVGHNHRNTSHSPPFYSIFFIQVPPPWSPLFASDSAQI